MSEWMNVPEVDLMLAPDERGALLNAVSNKTKQTGCILESSEDLKQTSAQNLFQTMKTELLGVGIVLGLFSEWSAPHLRWFQHSLSL